MVQKRVRLTKGMLEAMMRALTEYLAGEGPMGLETDDEIEEIQRNAHRAADWVGQELDRREQKSR